MESTQNQINKGEEGATEAVQVVLERHTQRIKALEREVSLIREVQTEIRTMNETLITLAGEMKHANAHLCEQERRITEMERAPYRRTRELATAALASLIGAVVTALLHLLLL